MYTFRICIRCARLWFIFSVEQHAFVFVFEFVHVQCVPADFLRFVRVHFYACANERISERAHAIFTVVFRILNSSLFSAAAAVALSDSSFKMQTVKLQRAHTYRILTERGEPRKGPYHIPFFFSSTRKKAAAAAVTYTCKHSELMSACMVRKTSISSDSYYTCSVLHRK